MKLLTLEEAIERFVPDGASVAVGTALESLIPFAAGHALMRAQRRDLELIGSISDMLFDQLIGAGCVRRITAAWVGNVRAGLGSRGGPSPNAAAHRRRAAADPRGRPARVLG
jgi:glutaconate CoA-transferase subunit A